jgi:hypothetical protein
VRRWREKLSPQEAAVIERMAKSQMEEFGYSPQMSGTAALAGRERALTWPLRRRLARLSRLAPALDHADDRSDE